MESVDPNQPDGSEETPNSVGVDGPFETADPHEELERILGAGCDADGLKESGTYNQIAEVAPNQLSHECLDLVKSEMPQLPPASSEDVLERLQDVANFVQDRFQGQAQCMLMCDSDQRPFLTILSYHPDPFLVDRGTLTLNCFVNDSLQVIGKLLTFNRDVIDEVEADSNCDDLVPLLENLVGNQFQVCPGYREQDHSELFSRMRKSDFFYISIDRFCNDLIFRARDCSYLVDTSEDDQNPISNCSQCKKFYCELDMKYCQGNFSKPPAPPQLPVKLDSETENEEKRKRGRPKGSKSKNIFPQPEVQIQRPEVCPKIEKDPDGLNPELVKKEVTDCLQNELSRGENLDESQEDDTAMVDDPTDEDYKNVPRRGIRKRITTKRQKALLALSKRKRGRPPIVAGPFECTQCGLKLTMLKDYRKHCLEHTNSFACDFGECDRRFKSPKELEIHTRKHRGEKPYVCNECDKAYQIRQDLKLHMRKHTGDRPFQCELCPKTFARSQQRKIHMVVHTGERAYLCSECGSSFGSVSTLIDHRKRKHLMMRNHKCNNCSKAFFTKQELAAHQRTHTGDKPFACTDCGKCFSRSHHLKRHVSGVHRCEKSRTGTHTTYIVTKEDIDEEDENDEQVLGLGSTYDGETVLVTTDTSVLVGDMEDEDMIETEYVVQGGFSPSGASVSGTTQLLLQKVNPSGAGVDDQVQYLHLTHDDGEGGEGERGRTILLQQDHNSASAASVMELTGTDEGGYVLITTADNQQKLVPVAQFVSAMQQQQQQHQQEEDNILP